MYRAVTELLLSFKGHVVKQFFSDVFDGMLHLDGAAC